MQMQFTMPFNWNIKRINGTNIFVHQEVYIPKANAFTNNGSFIGKVNGVDVSKQIVVDNSNPGRDIIHVMLPKDTVLKVADQIKRNDQQLIHNGTDQLMSFELSLSAKSVLPQRLEICPCPWGPCLQVLLPNRHYLLH